MGTGTAGESDADLLPDPDYGMGGEGLICLGNYPHPGLPCRESIHLNSFT